MTMGVRRFAAIALTALLLTTLAGCTSPSESAKQGAAAATHWLEMIDQGKYSEAWEVADEQMKPAAMYRRKFVKKMTLTRTALGKELSRSLKDQTYEKNPENEPPGEYVRVHYDSSFEHSKAETETVLVKKQRNGEWRVTFYQVGSE
jgi:Protein of unknown function (DUF4019)